MIADMTHDDKIAEGEVLKLRLKMERQLRSFGIIADDDEEEMTFTQRNEFVTALAIVKSITDVKKCSSKMRAMGEEEMKGGEAEKMPPIKE